MNNIQSYSLSIQAITRSIPSFCPRKMKEIGMIDWERWSNTLDRIQEKWRIPSYEGITVGNVTFRKLFSPCREEKGAWCYNVPISQWNVDAMRKDLLEL